MWQSKEDEEEVSWSKSNSSRSEKKGPHRDYQLNLETCLNFINKTRESCPRGINVEVTGSQWLEKSLLTISWHPPSDFPQGNWANSIFLHQDKFTFGRELENTFNSYVRKAEDFERKNLMQYKEFI